VVYSRGCVLGYFKSKRKAQAFARDYRNRYLTK
jgi:hypothetical protein